VRKISIKYISKGDGSAILCLHGLGLDYNSFLPQINYLSDEYKVIAWKMPSFETGEIKEMSFKNLASAGFELLDSLNIKNCHIIGHSMGGMIAIEMALLKKHRVKSLCLLGATSAFGGKDNTFKNSFLQSRLKPLSEGRSMSDIAKLNVPLMFSKNARQTYIDASIKAMAETSENNYRLALECLTTFDKRKEISLIEQPCCLIAASLDQAAPSKTIKKMSTNIKRSIFHLIEDCGHMMQLDKVDQVNHILRTFIK